MPRRPLRQLVLDIRSTWRPDPVCLDHLVDPDCLAFHLDQVDLVDRLVLECLHHLLEELERHWDLWDLQGLVDQLGLSDRVDSSATFRLVHLGLSGRVCHLVHLVLEGQLGRVDLVFLVELAALVELVGLWDLVDQVVQEVRVDRAVVAGISDSSLELHQAVSCHRVRYHLVCHPHHSCHPHRVVLECPLVLVGILVVEVSNCILELDVSS